MSSAIQERIDALYWANLCESLSERGYAVTDRILSPEECASIVSVYNEPSRFRSHIIMERHRFGVGDYKYFSNPLPGLVSDLRTAAYPHLAKVANEWASAFGEEKTTISVRARGVPENLPQGRPDETDAAGAAL